MSPGLRASQAVLISSFLQSLLYSFGLMGFPGPFLFTQLILAALLSEVTSLKSVLQALASGLGSIDWVNMDAMGFSYAPHYLDEH